MAAAKKVREIERVKIQQGWPVFEVQRFSTPRLNNPQLPSRCLYAASPQPDLHEH